MNLRMNRLTRTALQLLEREGTAHLTADNTTLDGRRTKRLCINKTTARALVRRGHAQYIDGDMIEWVHS